MLGEGSEKLEAFLEKYSVEEKIPYLSQSSKKLEPGNNHFVLEKSLEDQAVDLGFFAYNEAFRKMGILLQEGDEKSKTLAEQLSESFPEYGGTVEIRAYKGEEDFQAKFVGAGGSRNRSFVPSKSRRAGEGASFREKPITSFWEKIGIRRISPGI